MNLVALYFASGDCLYFRELLTANGNRRLAAIETSLNVVDTKHRVMDWSGFHGKGKSTGFLGCCRNTLRNIFPMVYRLKHRETFRACRLDAVERSHGLVCFSSGAYGIGVFSSEDAFDYRGVERPSRCSRRSISSGISPQSPSWPTVLQQLTGIPVRNLAKPGAGVMEGRAMA